MDNSRVAYVELLGVTLSGRERPDQGLYWTDLEGWWGLPDLRGETDLIPGAHGRFSRSSYYRESRAITLTGHILCETNRELVAVRDRLEAALSAGAGVMTVVTGETGAWDRFVEIDTLNIDPDHGKLWTKFTVDMVAPDPRRYGPLSKVGPVTPPASVGGVRLPQRMPWNFGSVSQNSRLIIPNAGSIPMSPSIEVAGGFDSVTVTDITAGRRLVLDWQVSSGESVVFSSRSRRAEIGSVEVTRWLTHREWFVIPPGETHEFRFEVENPSGNPRMWGEYREGAW